MDHNQILGEKVRQERIKKNITQEELGKVIGVDKQTVYKIEKGKRKVTIDELVKLSNRLDKNFEFFLDSEGYKKKQEDSKITYEIVEKATDKVLDSFALSDYKYGIIVSEAWDKLLKKIGKKDIYVRLNYSESQLIEKLMKKEGEMAAIERAIKRFKSKNKS